MTEEVKDLIRIIKKQKKAIKTKEKPTDDSEVMNSEDDDNPDGEQSGDQKNYTLIIDPEIINEMSEMEATTLRVVRNGQGGNSSIEIIYK